MGRYDVNDIAYSYKASSGYETFMRRAYRTSHGYSSDKLFLKLSVMQNLIRTENGDNYVKIPIEKQLSQIKQNIHNGFDKFLKIKMSDAKRNSLTKLKNQIDYSDSSYQLIEIIEQGIELTQEFK